MPLRLPSGKPGGLSLGMPPSGAMAQGDGDSGVGARESAEQAGYMELEGAQKDADCRKVQVEGGVSSDLGCCNEFEPKEGADAFKCGNCQYLQSAQGGEDEQKPAGGEEAAASGAGEGEGGYA